MSYPEMVAERIRKQAAAVNISATRLICEEMLDMNRTYMLALELILKESQNVDSTGRRISGE